MTQSIKKSVAQVAVLLYAVSIPGIPLLSLAYPLAILLLFVAAILPSSDKDTWGSMWPLVGYDNAIDAIYTRGPWLVRFQEMDDAEREQRITDA